MAMYDNLLANVPTDHWIGGKWRKSSDGGRFDVIDPATENTVASVASATVDDAKAAAELALGHQQFSLHSQTGMAMSEAEAIEYAAGPEPDQPPY